MSPSRPAAKSSGLLFGLGAYGSWGLFPAFFPLLNPAGPFEVIAHRIVWTAVFLAAALVLVRRLGDLRRITRRVWLLLAVASVLITANWTIYVFAVTNGHVVDAALGYFITPLVSVALGVVIFRERINAAQGVALAISVTAVVVLCVQLGSPPWVAFGIALSFGCYGLVKKLVPTDPRVSVGVEAAIMAPVALGYLALLGAAGDGQFLGNGPWHTVLMVASGPLTAVPLLLFAAAAQRLPMVTLGLLMYLNPAMQMTWGIVVGHEAMPPARWLGFALIWTALAVFSVDAIVRARRESKNSKADVDPGPA